jgi:hypothetical protein
VQLESIYIAEPETEKIGVFTGVGAGGICASAAQYAADVDVNTNNKHNKQTNKQENKTKTTKTKKHERSKHMDTNKQK